jgi:phosphoribosylanthranilate isomerase
MRAAKLDIAQIYGGSAPKGARVWKACRMSGNSDPAQPGVDSIEIVDLVMTLEEAFEPSIDGPEAVLLDGPANGISFDWSLARNGSVKLIIAGGLDASNVARAIRIVKPWGVDASSRLESSPGIKDHDKVRRFVEAARMEADLHA